MSAIIDAGENLMLERQVSIAQTKTQGGRRLAQKRGPTLYNLEVDVPPQRMNEDTYYAIENEVITLEYGAQTFHSASINGQIRGNFTSVRGDWTAATVALASIAGNVVTLSNTTVAGNDGTPLPYDYLQFPGSTKVYQVVSVAEESNGNRTVTLNTPLAAPISATNVVVIGDDVQFNFALIDRPSTSYQPGDIVHYGTFKFEEVIE